MSPVPQVPVEAVRAAIATLQAAVGSATRGLPEEIFLFVSSLTPMLNVDLLIRDADGRTLLTWRHDAFYGPGWHIPGGIIRFKELAATRIAAVATGELGAEVSFCPDPLCIHELFNTSRDVRGHFVSQLFDCTLLSELDPSRRFDASAPRNGAWLWHERAPDNLIPAQDRFRPFIDARPHEPIAT
jgi:ADP-ribose pyrophosphatase YjhB (NUDIX family)